MSEENTTPEPEGAADGQDLDAPALAAEVQALKEQVLRYAAEAENIKRRAEREANDARAYAITKFARDLLGVADIFERAMAAAPKEHADAAVKGFVDGVGMTSKELQAAFERNGLKRIDPASRERKAASVISRTARLRSRRMPCGVRIRWLRWTVPCTAIS